MKGLLWREIRPKLNLIGWKGEIKGRKENTIEILSVQ